MEGEKLRSKRSTWRVRTASYDEDYKGEGRKADEEVKIYNINEDFIKTYWDKLLEIIVL